MQKFLGKLYKNGLLIGCRLPTDVTERNMRKNVNKDYSK